MKVSDERLKELEVEDDLYNYPPTQQELNGMAKELLNLRKAREGWQMVPVEPTTEMLRAWRGDMYKSYAKNHIEHIGDDEIGFAWAAMITVAPTPHE